MITTSCVSREGCVPTQVKTVEEPEEPVRHSVTGNGERDGAKAERSEEDAVWYLAGWQYAENKTVEIQC